MLPSYQGRTRKFQEYQDVHACSCQAQARQPRWATKIASDAGQRQDAHKEKVKKARKEKKDKTHKQKKKKHKPEDEVIREEARWEDRAQRQDEAANREGKIISIAETRSGRKRKVTSSAFN